MPTIYEPHQERLDKIFEYLVDQASKEDRIALDGAEINSAPGIYMLYYQGSNDLYADCIEHLAVTPIYIGTAHNLKKRLNEHVDSIDATGLGKCNFQCQVIVFSDIHRKAFEQAAIVRYQPLWNKLLVGFGAKEPGIKRTESSVSYWDIAHPGRNRGVHAEHSVDVDYLKKMVRRHFNLGTGLIVQGFQSDAVQDTMYSLTNHPSSNQPSPLQYPKTPWDTPSY